MSNEVRVRSWFATITKAGETYNAGLCVESNGWDGENWTDDIQHEPGTDESFKSWQAAYNWLERKVGEPIEMHEAEKGWYWRGFVDIDPTPKGG